MHWLCSDQTDKPCGTVQSHAILKVYMHDVQTDQLAYRVNSKGMDCVRGAAGRQQDMVMVLQKLDQLSVWHEKLFFDVTR